MPGPSWNQWKNRRLQITMRSSAFPSVSERRFFFFPSGLRWFSSCLHLNTWLNELFTLIVGLFSFFAPTDLKTMTERLKNRYYVTKKLFIADLQRIITNCREYNVPDSEYCKCANTLEKFFYFKLKDGGLIEKWTDKRHQIIYRFRTDEEPLSQRPNVKMEPIMRTSMAVVISNLIKGFVHDWQILQGKCWTWTNITENCLEISELVEHYEVSK